MIWCTNEPNNHIYTFGKRWSFIWQCFFPVGILKKVFKSFLVFYLPFVMHVCSLYERRKKEDGRTGHHSLKRVDAQIIQCSMTKSLWNKIISILQQIIKPFFIDNLEIYSCITNKLCHSYLSKFIIALS